MSFSAPLARLNAATPRRCGDPGTYTENMTGIAHADIDIVLEDVTGQIATEGGPVEARPVAYVRESDVAAPEHGDRIEIFSRRFLVDDMDRDNGLWTLTLREETSG